MISNDVQNGINKRYPVGFEVSSHNPVSPEAVKQLATPPEKDFALLDETAQRLLHEDVYEEEYPFNYIFADEPYRQLSDPALRDSIFILDIRSLDIAGRDGHIDVSQYARIDWSELGQSQNLGQLPKDKLIVVVGSTGQSAGQVTLILRMLGYNAVTLRSGMTAWTETPDNHKTLETMRHADYPLMK